jgi:hypothetical protein
MSDIAGNLGFDARKWSWFVALDVVMVLAGGFAWGDTVLVTLVSVIFIGAALIVGGVLQIIHAFANREPLNRGVIDSRTRKQRAQRDALSPCGRASLYPYHLRGSDGRN